MRTFSVIITALATLAFVTPAIAQTDSGVCTDQLQVAAIPGSGEAGYWVNDCIVTSATEVTLTFASTDGLPHQAKAEYCFDTKSMGAGAQRIVTLELRNGLVWNGNSPCSFGANAKRDGAFLVPNPMANANEAGPVLVANADDSVTIHYVCAVHGAAMHGTITLGAQAAY